MECLEWRIREVSMKGVNFCPVPGTLPVFKENGASSHRTDSDEANPNVVTEFDSHFLCACQK
jgi:hypothetical protein